MLFKSRKNRKKITWVNDGLLKVDDVKFVVSCGKELYEDESREGTFILGKTRAMIDDYLTILANHPINRIVDLGIYKGGSAVLYQKVFDPKTLVAIDWVTTPVQALDEYISQNNLEETIRVYYGVDQADAETMTGIIKSDLGNDPIDLVIDDASHRLQYTRASFNILFPYLAAGGTYIIEDWAWAHWKGEQWQDNGGLFPDEPPLTNLVFELTMLAASRPDLVASIVVKRSYIVVTKGRANCDPGSFDISSSYLNRGRPVTLLT
jgi:hypothetical protein